MSTSRTGSSSASPRALPAIHRGLLAVLVASTGVLSACYVVPLDPRTGQPYPTVVSRDPSAPPVGTVLAAPSQSTTLTVRLYPVNEQANAGGMLSATVVDNNAGHGSFSVAYRGDILVGESTRVDAGYVGFGRIHDEVLGRPIGSVQRSYGGRRGVANAYGAKGVNAQCEYLISGPGMGTGACLFSDGAKYQMHFAG